jgi:glycosyl transferase family 1
MRALPTGYRERIEQAWGGSVDLLYEGRSERRLRGLARAVRHASRYDAFVLDGSVGLKGAYLDLLAAAAVRPRRSAVVVIADCQWELSSSVIDRAAMRTGLRLVDAPRVTYCVHSSDEVAIFARTWRVDPERVAFTPWPYVLREDELGETQESDGIFAGGDSLRDYGPLLEAAHGLPWRVTVATRRDDLIGRGNLPANVELGPMPHEQYIERLRSSPIVVVPLVPTANRSAGQTTYVNALAMGKLVVVTDCLGVRDYVEAGLTGLVVPPRDAQALHDALAWAVDPANTDEVRAIRERARTTAQERLRPDDYVVNLLRVAAAARERLAIH